MRFSPVGRRYSREHAPLRSLKEYYIFLLFMHRIPHRNFVKEYIMHNPTHDGPFRAVGKFGRILVTLTTLAIALDVTVAICFFFKVQLSPIIPRYLILSLRVIISLPEWKLWAPNFVYSSKWSPSFYAVPKPLCARSSRYLFLQSVHCRTTASRASSKPKTQSYRMLLRVGPKTEPCGTPIALISTILPPPSFIFLFLSQGILKPLYIAAHGWSNCG